jgi:NAD-specific glutamate dehydrogenase
MSQYLVIYDRSTGHSEVQEYSGQDGVERALAARFAAEQSAGPNVEIATLTASNEAELRVTHSRYFRSASEMFGDFERLLAS